MAARSMWKGTVGFGLVSVPCKLYSATEEQKVSLNQLHRKCGGRVQIPKWCPTCNAKVLPEEVVKGFEVGEGQYIRLEDTDLASLPVSTLKAMTLVEFVPAHALDPRQMHKSYFLAPDKTGVRAFSLLLKCMEKLDMVALAQLAFREREHLAAVRPFRGVLLVQTLFYASELRSAADVALELPAVSDRETDMGMMLMQSMVNPEPDLGKYHDLYHDALMNLINAKVAGQEVTVAPAQAQPQVLDLAEALLASIQARAPEKVKVEKVEGKKTRKAVAA